MKNILIALLLSVASVALAADGTFTTPTQSFAEFTPPYGTTLPATCTPPKTFIKTDATAAAQTYQCTATNTWTQQVGTGGGGGVTNPIVLTNGVDTLTLNATGSYISRITASNTLFLEYGVGGMVAVPGVNSQTSTPTDACANCMSLWRRGMWIGRHGGQTGSFPTVIGPAGIGIEGHANDDNTGTLYFIGQNAYPQATTNTTGGNVLIAPGAGSRSITITNYATLTGKAITASVNGVVTTRTEGAGWTAATSNAATATSLAASLDSIDGIDVVVVSNVIYVKPVQTSYTLGPIYNFKLSSNDSGAVVTQGVDGKIQAGTTAISATTPASFSATHYIPILDGLGNTYYMPVSNAPW